MARSVHGRSRWFKASCSIRRVPAAFYGVREWRWVRGQCVASEVCAPRAVRSLGADGWWLVCLANVRRLELARARISSTLSRSCEGLQRDSVLVRTEFSNV